MAGMKSPRAKVLFKPPASAGWRLGPGRVRGLSTFLAERGAPARRCLVCNSWCYAKRGVLAHGSWAAYVGGRKSPHDFFWCRWVDLGWHVDITKMLERLEDDDFDPVRRQRPAIARTLQVAARRLAAHAERQASKPLRE